MLEIRKNNPEIFDQIDTPYNYKIDSTLKLIILKYNQAIENGIGLQFIFKTIEHKTSELGNNLTLIFNRIAHELSKGNAPSIKEINIASKYFNNDEPPNKKPISSNTIPTINLNTLRQMVEWDSRMRILSNGERAYMADLAYELKPLNEFHKKNAD